MIEKVNPSHPDKIADRIAGAIVDVAYSKTLNPKIAVEVLIGHGKCLVIAESDTEITHEEANDVVRRIAGDVENVEFLLVPQDVILSKNQEGIVKCGDNGIFKGVPLTDEERRLSDVARRIYADYPFDGKYILDGDNLVICQSCTDSDELLRKYPTANVNPLGNWTGGVDVDSGATNRKLGSDMAQSVTGGGLHGKDLSKADVTLNIFAFREAQRTSKEIQIHCAIGDEFVCGRPYREFVEEAREYINNLGGFEKFAEWGLF